MPLECVELTAQDYAEVVLSYYVPNAHLLEDQQLECYNRALCMQVAFLDANPGLLSSLGTVTNASTRNFSVAQKAADEFQGDQYVSPMAYRHLLNCGLVSSKIGRRCCTCR